jgi:hypothetical protein
VLRVKDVVKVEDEGAVVEVDEAMEGEDEADDESDDEDEKMEFNESANDEVEEKDEVRDMMKGCE